MLKPGAAMHKMDDMNDMLKPGAAMHKMDDILKPGVHDVPPGAHDMLKPSASEEKMQNACNNKADVEAAMTCQPHGSYLLADLPGTTIAAVCGLAGGALTMFAV